jgi:hypothetical protein
MEMTKQDFLSIIASLTPFSGADINDSWSYTAVLLHALNSALPLASCYVRVPSNNAVSLPLYLDFNQSPRNMYQCQMGKQPMGMPSQTLKYRSDNKIYALNSGQVRAMGIVRSTAVHAQRRSPLIPRRIWPPFSAAHGSAPRLQPLLRGRLSHGQQCHCGRHCLHCTYVCRKWGLKTSRGKW